VKLSIDLKFSKKKGHFLAILKIIDSFVSNNRHTVLFNKQFVDPNYNKTAIK